MSRAACVEARDLRRDFRKKGSVLEVLRGVTVSLAPGEMLGIVGVSGAGKTTLLQILGTLDRPTSGSVLYDGQEVSGWDETRLAEFRNRTIGFIFQFHHLLPEFDARENVVLPCRIAGMDVDDARRRAEALLSEVGLGERLDHQVGELSGGEQQRVALCRALVMEPKVLLADEPTGNLDRETALGVVDLLLELNRRRGLSLVVVTHNDELAGRMHRVVRIVGGRTVPC